MNILFVSSEFPIDKYSETGGIGTYLVNLSSVLEKHNNKICLITKKEKKKHIHKNLHIIELDCSVPKNNIPRLHLFDKLISFIEYPLIFSIKTAFIINKIVKKYNIDLVECRDRKSVV